MHKTLNEILVDAVTTHNTAAVRDCLEKGADPNHHWQVEYSPVDQPDTPLRLVMFCISDAMLNRDDLRDFAEIAKLLLEYGADPKPAMQIAESRYGKYSPDHESSPLMDVWHIVANADGSGT